LPPASPARNSKAGKKESMGRRLSQLCPPYATPSSNSSLDYRRSDARIVANGFATSGGLSKSAKVVLGAGQFALAGRRSMLSMPCSMRGSVEQSEENQNGTKTGNAC